MATHHPTLQLGPDDHGRAVTADEFAEADFAAPWTYERVDGRLVVMSPEGQRHHDDSRPWRKYLHRYWLEHPEVVDDIVVNAWVRVHDGTDRVGDLGVYLRATKTDASIPDRVPDLMFEVVSPGREARTRDYDQKRADYHRLGVREYVIVDCGARLLTVLTRGPRQYRSRVLRPTDTYTSPLLPGLQVPLIESF